MYTVGDCYYNRMYNEEVTTLLINPTNCFT